MAHTELDLRERRLIEDLLLAKVSVARITKRLSRHRSTIYREVGRSAKNAYRKTGRRNDGWNSKLARRAKARGAGQRW